MLYLVISLDVVYHISTGECMSGFWELISYDQYAMFRYLVKSIVLSIRKYGLQ